MFLAEMAAVMYNKHVFFLFSHLAVMQSMVYQKNMHFRCDF